MTCIKKLFEGKIALRDKNTTLDKLVKHADCYEVTIKGTTYLVPFCGHFDKNNHVPDDWDLVNDIEGTWTITNSAGEIEYSSSAKDEIEHPAHYINENIRCLGCDRVIETWDITDHFDSARSNVIKYVWRMGEKGDALKDLKKARQYLDRKIMRLEKCLK